jgi:hypothetical protein
MRYAISSSADVFHLVTESEDTTLCRLKVAPIIINRPARSSTLYLTEQVESDRRLCEECAAVEAVAQDKDF